MNILKSQAKQLFACILILNSSTNSTFAMQPSESADAFSDIDSLVHVQSSEREVAKKEAQEAKLLNKLAEEQIRSGNLDQAELLCKRILEVRRKYFGSEDWLKTALIATRIRAKSPYAEKELLRVAPSLKREWQKRVELRKKFAAYPAIAEAQTYGGVRDSLASDKPASEFEDNCISMLGSLVASELLGSFFCIGRISDQEAQIEITLNGAGLCPDYSSAEDLFLRLGTEYCWKHRAAKSQILIERSLRLYQLFDGSNRSVSLRCLAELGLSMQLQEKHTDALRIFEAILTTANQKYVDASLRSFVSGRLAKEYARKGNYPKALELIAAWVDALDSGSEASHPDSFQLLYLAGEIMRKTNHKKEAKAFESSLKKDLKDLEKLKRETVLEARQASDSREHDE